MSKIQSIRGMYDILPAETPLWQYIEAELRQVLSQYAYREVRFPVLEQTELFKRSIGEVTDIVEKEMYSFDDRNGDSLTLRPEGTACCVRAAEQGSLLANQQQQKLWYMGPMFRHERPQKGRQRQFHQLGVEAFGMTGPDIDAELIIMTARLWQRFGVSDALTLEINSIGSADERAAYREALVNYLSPLKEQLDEDSQRRLDSNPMRILDSKNGDTQALLRDAPSLEQFLGEASLAHFNGLLSRLDAAGVAYTINRRLVRGLDYYGLSVFEWVTDALGAQGTVCAGGRYDGLVEQLGGKPCPAVGFGMGMERLGLLLQALDAVPALNPAADVYIVAADLAAAEAMQMAENLRTELPDLRVQCHMGGGSFKSQFKKADKSGAQVALVLAEEEVAAKTVTLKHLRDAEAGQSSCPQAELATRLNELFTR